MRTVTGAILLLTAEQAFAHAHLVGFPNVAFVRQILIPASLLLALFGLAFVVWGVLTERKQA